MITLAKFLAISGIILPMLPKEPLIPGINLTPYTIWLATVVAVSYTHLALDNISRYFLGQNSQSYRQGSAAYSLYYQQILGGLDDVFRLQSIQKQIPVSYTHLFAVYLHLIIFDTRFRISYFELNLTCLPLRFI